MEVPVVVVDVCIDVGLQNDVRMEILYWHMKEWYHSRNYREIAMHLSQMNHCVCLIHFVWLIWTPQMIQGEMNFYLSVWQIWSYCNEELIFSYVVLVC